MGTLEQELNKYKYIIFDFDGTIVNLHVDWRGLKNTLARMFNLDFHSLNEGLKKLDKDELTIAFKVIEKYENTSRYEVNSKLVRYIRENNKKYAIFSDNMVLTISKILTELGIRSKFEIIVGKDSVNNFKPSEEGIIKILNHFGINNSKKREVIYVGDDKKDEAIARKVNVKFLNIKL
ncbi:MAG: HAD family hydrolase [Candidatus Desulfofervidus auxilii]|nr:HAD family hydrolase [Candidatus Desulfofervidus auxilii]